MSSVLIISFYFPPYPKVGSRRWVKFAKYLNRAGKQVHVLAAKMDVDKKSPWDHDAKEIAHLTTSLPFKYKTPYYKSVTPKSLAEKAAWHASKLYNGLRAKSKSAGNPSDSSEQYAPEFIKKARELISAKKITTVIFTASPNHLAFHISGLKKEFPQVKFIFDLRDYWSDWMQHLPQSQFEHEAKLEQQTILNSDLIITPAQKIKETLALKYPAKSAVLHTLPHAYDADDFDLADVLSTIDPSHSRLVYAGTMYPNMQANMQLLAALLNRNPELSLTFYTFTNDYQAIFTDLIKAGRVSYLAPLDIKAFTAKMQQQADALLYMRSDLNDDNNFLSSKFFDFLPFKKPIIYLGKKGDASDFIESNQIGFHLTHENMAQFSENIDKTALSALQFNNALFSFKNVTQQLTALIES